MKNLFPVRTIILAGCLVLQLTTFSLRSHGAAGDVDLSFDPGSGVNGPVNAVAVQPDGKVIIGGQFTTVKGLVRVNVARLNADGSSDSSFNPGAGPHGVSSLVLQPDGKVLVGHSTWLNAGSIPNWGILRLNSDGSLDSNFSASIESFSENAGVYSIALQSDGKVLIGGGFSAVNGTGRSGIARLNANGTLDGSFHPDAVLCCANSVSLQPDGKVLFIGVFTLNGTNRNTIARLNANGSLDNTFDAGGGLSASNLGLQPDGKVLVAGYFTPPIGYQIARLNSDGSLDDSFNPSLPPYEGHPYVGSLVAQSDGKVLITGDFTSVEGSNRNGIARLNVNGSLDNSFDPGTGASGIASVALQSDGKVLIGGSFTVVQGTKRNHIARLNANGSLDGSFNSGNEISGDVSPQVSSVVVQPDGKVLIGGWFNSVQGTRRNRIARLNSSGSLDTSFDPGTGVNGIVTAIALQPDDKVLVAGSFITINGTFREGIARLNANGSLDSGFAPNLRTLNPYDDCVSGYSCSTYPEAFAVVVQSDDKVLVGGVFWTVVYGQQEGEDTTYLSRCFLARFNADGSPDAGFAPLVGTSATTALRALSVQPDGKVVVIGNFLNGTNWSAIIRINANGALDNSFNAATGVYGLSSVASQPDGKVLIAGSFWSVNGTNRHQIARLNANGSLDSSFNPNAGISVIGGSSISTIALQPDGKVLIGGGMYILNYPLPKGLARLNANGGLDTNYHNPSIDGSVTTVALQSDGNVLISGDFTIVNGVARPRVARLYGDSAAPSLGIARSIAFVTLSWPVSDLNFQLQETTNLALQNSWSPVAQPAVTNAGQISVSVPASVGSRFFRLQSQ